MSNQAWLLVSNSPEPYDPNAEDNDAGAKMLAGAPYAVPVFWLACYDLTNLAVVTTGEGTITTLVAPLEEARQRLETREPILHELFPEYQDSWILWCSLLQNTEAEFLKLDTTEISALADSDLQFREQLTSALRWFDSRDEFDFQCLLALSGIEEYDAEEHRIVFDEEEEDVEKFLLGWLEDDA